MKTKIYTLGLIFTTLSSIFAQKLSDTDILTYAKMIDKEEGKKFKNGMDIKAYVASDKNTYKIGDTLVLGNPTGEIRSGFSTKSSFKYIFYGKPAGILLKGLRYVEPRYKDYKVTIEKIQFNKGSMGLENYIFFYVKPLPNINFTILDNYITITMVDNAIIKGEVRPLNNNRPLTRDEAIELLKKKKEELDLEIITKEDFEILKDKLTPIIKTNK
ncbi:hypothetical protein [Elizabethkingia anophelis]|uniref:hypothetical protein n=1 Tax=Elizabethkingia anophelis TaxID=1117645 RepID=UPI0011EA736B|nr:hypothetical protein [Elizabethkingia anophelis]TYT28256.1 hypothetical protein FZC31_14080 [Elizabethkingia anophelis]UKY88765.1 hypothetical protein KUF64_10705 [Elizabethkingia anophelis]UKY95935.1 hypothetical protein KUF68_10725 [Elizabethkingia anophelis]